MRAPPASRDKNYYHFHYDHEHDTKNYFSLKNEIEDFIQHGYLSKYIHEEGTRPGKQTPV